jgi:hypothetical protein
MKNVIFVLISIFFFTKTSEAEAIPPGCYVADSYRTDPCWTSYDGYYAWSYNINRYLGAEKYGSAMEAIIHDWYIQTNSLNLCVNDVNTMVTSNNTSLIVIQAQTKLIKKLRKKCGAACKRVK